MNARLKNIFEWIQIIVGFPTGFALLAFLIAEKHGWRYAIEWMGIAVIASCLICGPLYLFMKWYAKKNPNF